MCEPAEIDDWLAVVDGGDGTPVDGAGAAPGAAADGPPSDTPNSLMAGARNSPLPPVRRHTADEAARDRGGRGGAGGRAGGRWPPLAGPLGQAPGEGAGRGEGGGDAGGRGSEGRDAGGQEPAAAAPPRRRRFSTGALGRSFSGHRPPPVQVRTRHRVRFSERRAEVPGCLWCRCMCGGARPVSSSGPAYARLQARPATLAAARAHSKAAVSMSDPEGRSLRRLAESAAPRAASLARARGAARARGSQGPAALPRAAGDAEVARHRALGHPGSRQGPGGRPGGRGRAGRAAGGRAAAAQRGAPAVRRLPARGPAALPPARRACVAAPAVHRTWWRRAAREVPGRGATRPPGAIAVALVALQQATAPCSARGVRAGRAERGAARAGAGAWW